MSANLDLLSTTFAEAQVKGLEREFAAQSLSLFAFRFVAELARAIRTSELDDDVKDMVVESVLGEAKRHADIVTKFHNPGYDVTPVGMMRAQVDDLMSMLSANPKTRKIAQQARPCMETAMHRASLDSQGRELPADSRSRDGKSSIFAVGWKEATTTGRRPEFEAAVMEMYSTYVDGVHAEVRQTAGPTSPARKAAVRAASDEAIAQMRRKTFSPGVAWPAEATPARVAKAAIEDCRRTYFDAVNSSLPTGILVHAEHRVFGTSSTSFFPGLEVVRGVQR